MKTIPMIRIPFAVLALALSSSLVVPLGVVVSDNGSRVFIANTFAGTVSTIDAATQRVIGTVRVGSGPGGITYRPASR
jgi:YVTN family beta-propeller protein